MAVTGCCHDVRNGLGVVEGLATAVALRDARREESTEAIREQADEMTTLIEDAEAIAATLGGDPDVDRVDLAPIVVDACERVAETFGADVSVDAPETAFVQGTSHSGRS
jgi:signal transduction histidine kinase